MVKRISACGVICSDCPAYLGEAKGLEHQERTAAASLSCGGCTGPEDKLFHSSRSCRARLCFRSKGVISCAECSVESCSKLEKVQSIWDGVPDLATVISRADFVTYAKPYCGHRRRLAAARARPQRASPGKV